jgi:hypothetical protein
VTDNPANIAGGEKYITRSANAEDVADSEIQANCIAACFSNDTLR